MVVLVSSTRCFRWHASGCRIFQSEKVGTPHGALTFNKKEACAPFLFKLYPEDFLFVVMPEQAELRVGHAYA